MQDFYAGKQVVVAGGAGFIGSHLVELLINRGAAVTVPVRTTTNRENLRAVHDQIRFITANLFDPDATRRAVAHAEILFDLTMSQRSGIIHSAQHHASMFRDTMVPFLNLLEAARESGVERTLVMSSACVYPREARVPTPESEGFNGSPDPANEGYGWAKRMEEYAATAYAQEYGMPIAIARATNTYGPRDKFFNPEIQVIPSLIRRLVQGENPFTVWGSGRQTRSFIYVQDLVRALLDLCERYAVADPVNLGSHEEVSIADLARLLIELLSVKTRLVFDASKPEGHARRFGDISKAESVIDFQPRVSLRDGLRQTISWYSAELIRRGEPRV